MSPRERLVRRKPSANPNEALAEAWASMDGKLELFKKDKQADDYGQGYYDGYLSDAKELRSRLKSRGYKIVRVSTKRRG